MKTTPILLAFSLLFSFGKAQQKFPLTDEYGPINYGVSSLSSKIPVYLTADKQTKSISPFNTIPNDPLGTMVYLEGATTVSVTTEVKKDSLSYYRYSIFENDTTVIQSNVQLSKVDFTWPDHSDLPGHLTMNFGVSDIRSKKITIKIYRLPEESKVTTIIIYNKPLNRARLTETNLISKGRVIKVKNGAFAVTKNLNNVIHLKNGFKINVDKKTRGIYLALEKTDLNFVYYVLLKNKSEDKDNMVFLSNNWNYNGPNENPINFIPASYFSDPGSYELSVTPMIGSRTDMSAIPSKQVMLTFTVIKPPATFGVSEVSIGLALIILFTGASILLITRKNKQKLTIINRQVETTKTELNNVRSQLNPHFVFNALGGIQNLINQNEIEKANRYLSKFARLTRNILDGKQSIALKDEHKLLDDYLAMERLRFNFNYEIKVNTTIDILEVMIPTMLLQPFVENAIKHSLSMLSDKGIMLVEFKSIHNNLILSIKDNGKGFDVEKVHEGFGLSLCKKRIDLLNQMHQECPISLDLHSDLNGTTVIITLNNWL